MNRWKDGALSIPIIGLGLLSVSAGVSVTRVVRGARIEWALHATWSIGIWGGTKVIWQS